jgi:hypothetical protein
MAYLNRAFFEPLKTLAGSAISGTYAAIGTPLSHPAVELSFKNQTNGDVIVSTDPTNAAGNLALPANSYTTIDVRTNAPYVCDLMFAEGTQFYAKAGASAPSTGNFFIESVIVETGVLT